MTVKGSRTVLVTGAEGALGRVVCERFLSAGYRVVGTYHHHEPPADQRITRLKMDASQSDSVRAGIASLRTSGIEIDCLAHCAGGFRYSMADQTGDEDIDFLINSNLKSALILIRELLPAMKTRNFGRIILVSSKATLNPPSGMSVYAATKAGLNAIVASVAEEVKKFDININALLPTIIDTPANRRDMAKADFSTWVTPAELADIMVSLTQDLGRPLNGSLIPVSGRV